MPSSLTPIKTQRSPTGASYFLYSEPDVTSSSVYLFSHSTPFVFHFFISMPVLLAFLSNSRLLAAVLLGRQFSIIPLITVLKGKAGKVDGLNCQEWKPTRSIWEAIWRVRRAKECPRSVCQRTSKKNDRSRKEKPQSGKFKECQQTGRKEYSPQ